MSFNKSDMDQYLARFVFSEILRFPTQESYKKSFVQEYILPQILMDIVNEKNWKGVTYSSCKKIENEKRCGFSEFVDKNFCFHVPYSDDRYNEQMLNNFIYAIWKQGDTLGSKSEVTQKLDTIHKLFLIANSNDFVMTDYVNYWHYIKSHIEKMEMSLGKRSYQRRMDCRVELALFSKILNQIEPIAKDPGKYGVAKNSDYR